MLRAPDPRPWWLYGTVKIALLVVACGAFLVSLKAPTNSPLQWAAAVLLALAGCALIWLLWLWGL